MNGMKYKVRYFVHFCHTFTGMKRAKFLPDFSNQVAFESLPLRNGEKYANETFTGTPKIVR